MQSTKIQINSLQALERLIGGDTQLEFEIRSNVVDAFTKKYLRSLVTTDIMKKASAALIDEIENKIFNITKGSYGSKTYTLNTDAKTKISSLVKDEMDSIISNIIHNELNIKAIREQLKDSLDRQTRLIASELTTNQIESRLSKMVDVRIKEKLGL